MIFVHLKDCSLSGERCVFTELQHTFFFFFQWKTDNKVLYGPVLWQKLLSEAALFRHENEK